MRCETRRDAINKNFDVGQSCVTQKRGSTALVCLKPKSLKQEPIMGEGKRGGT